jgi:hypothetical protein
MLQAGAHFRGREWHVVSELVLLHALGVALRA